MERSISTLILLSLILVAIVCFISFYFLAIAFDWRDDSYEVHPIPSEVKMYNVKNGVETPYYFEYSLKPLEQFDSSTGCRLVGTESVNMMSGTFFFSPGSLIKAALGLSRIQNDDWLEKNKMSW